MCLLFTGRVLQLRHLPIEALTLRMQARHVGRENVALLRQLLKLISLAQHALPLLFQRRALLLDAQLHLLVLGTDLRQRVAQRYALVVQLVQRLALLTDTFLRCCDTVLQHLAAVTRLNRVDTGLRHAVLHGLRETALCHQDALDLPELRVQLCFALARLIGGRCDCGQLQMRLLPCILSLLDALLSFVDELRLHIDLLFGIRSTSHELVHGVAPGLQLLHENPVPFLRFQAGCDGCAELFICALKLHLIQNGVFTQFLHTRPESSLPRLLLPQFLLPLGHICIIQRSIALQCGFIIALSILCLAPGREFRLSGLDSGLESGLPRLEPHYVVRDGTGRIFCYVLFCLFLPYFSLYLSNLTFSKLALVGGPVNGLGHCPEILLHSRCSLGRLLMTIPQFLNRHHHSLIFLLRFS